MAPVVVLVVVELHFTKRAESIWGSVVHERVPSVGEAGVERRKHGASIFVRCIVGGKVRVGQGVCVTSGGKFRGLAVPMPDTTANPMTMFEVFDPARTGFELVLRNPEGFGDIPCFVADQGIRKRDVLRDRRGG
jgi:hypothetical protein